MNIQLKSYLFMVATLILGIAIGVWLGRPNPGWPHPHPGGGHAKAWHHKGPPGQMAMRMKERLMHKLDLNEEQKKAVIPILDRHFDSLQAGLESHRAESKRLKQSLKSDLAPHLDAGQKEKLDRLLKHRGPGPR